MTLPLRARVWSCRVNSANLTFLSLAHFHSSPAVSVKTWKAILDLTNPVGKSAYLKVRKGCQRNGEQVGRQVDGQSRNDTGDLFMETLAQGRYRSFWKTFSLQCFIREKNMCFPPMNPLSQTIYCSEITLLLVVDEVCWYFIVTKPAESVWLQAEGYILQLKRV